MKPRVDRRATIGRDLVHGHSQREIPDGLSSIRPFVSVSDRFDDRLATSIDQQDSTGQVVAIAPTLC